MFILLQDEKYSLCKQLSLKFILGRELYCLGEYIDHCLIIEDKTLRIIIMNDIDLIKTEENIACGIFFFFLGSNIILFLTVLETRLDPYTMEGDEVSLWNLL